MRLWLIVLVLVFVGCTTTPPAAQPTLRGAIVPTRLIPTATDTQTASATLAEIPTDVAPTPTNAELPPSETLVPTEAPTDVPATAMLVPTEAPTDVPPTAILVPTETSEPTALPSETATDVPATAMLVPTEAPTDVPPTETLEPTALPSSTPTPTETATTPPTETPLPTATNTPEPTATPSPTPTDVPPTEMPSPTATSTPAPTETPVTVFEPVAYANATSFQSVDILGAVELSVPMHGTIDNQNPAALYSFAGTAGMVIDVEMWAQTEELDPFLILLDPKGRELVRNDDADDMGNAALRAVTLPETGTYVIVATRYGQRYGGSSGNFQLDVLPGSDLVFGTFSELIGYETSVNNQIDDSTDPQIYVFRATAGDVVTVQMTTTSGNLDPNLSLTDNIGTILAQNDDNLLLDTLDAAIQSYIIPRTGYYTIVTGRYSASANSGGYRLKLAREGQNTSSLYALLDVFNSTTINDAGDPFLNFYMGDLFDQQERERSYQVLLTFILPPPTGRLVESAALELAPCVQRGGGFAELGALTIYEENYGVITQTRNIAQPQPGARVLSTQTNCASIDLSSLVQAAYAIGDDELQFRLVFRNRVDNGSEDFLMVTPRLQINYAE